MPQRKRVDPRAWESTISILSFTRHQDREEGHDQFVKPGLLEHLVLPDLRNGLHVLSGPLALAVGSWRLSPGADFRCGLPGMPRVGQRLCNWSRAVCQRGRAAQEDLSQDEINLPIPTPLPALSPDLHRFAIHLPSSDAVPAIR